MEKESNHIAATFFAWLSLAKGEKKQKLEQGGWFLIKKNSALPAPP